MKNITQISAAIPPPQLMTWSKMVEAEYFLAESFPSIYGSNINK